MHQVKRISALVLLFSILIGFSCISAQAGDQVFNCLLEENFTELSSAWSAMDTIPEIKEEASYLKLSSNDNSTNGIITKTNILKDLTEYTVSFRAKVDSITTGPKAKSGTDDLNTFAVQLLPGNGKRFMFSLESDGIWTSQSSVTWAKTVSYPDNFNITEWHDWKLEVCADGTVNVYADGSKLGAGALQNVNGLGSGLKVYVKGTSTSPASSNLQNISVTSGETTVMSDTFISLDKSVWNSDSAVYPTAVKSSSYLHLSDSSYKNNGIARTVNYQGQTKFSITFDAKVNELTAGPGNPGSDFNSLGLQIFANGGRLAVSLEKDNIRATNNGATWGATLSYPDNISCTQWHNYRIDVDGQSASIYMDDKLIGTVSGFISSSDNAIKFFVRGNSTAPADAYVRNLSIGFYTESNLPKWDSTANLSISHTEDGFALSWPKAENATSYVVSIDGNAAIETSELAYTATGLVRKESGYAVTVTSKNDNGVSSQILTGIANVRFDFSSNELDDYQVMAGNSSGGDTKYSHYRIPGMVVTKQDTLIMYYEARMTASDWASMDILALRSSDQGETWSEPIILAEGAVIGKTMNNPIMIVGNDNTIHLLYCVQYGTCKTCNAAATSSCTHGCGVFYRKSTDDGVTWTEPVNISDQTSPDIRTVIATGPGHGICLKDGTLLVAVWYVQKTDATSLESHFPSVVSTLYSKDGGETWQLGEAVPNPDKIYSPNETVAVETEDGGVMLNIRAGGGGYRALAYSKTGYSDWTDMKTHKDLVDPTCFGSTVKYDIEGKPFTTLMVNCENTPGVMPSDRINLTVKGSEDNGKTWPIRKVINPGGAGYSDMAVDSNGNIYVLYEVNAGSTDRMARFSYEWLAGDIGVQLSSLKLDGTSKEFSFDGKETLQANAAPGATLTLNATARDDSATITINGEKYTSGSDYTYVYTSTNSTITICVEKGTFSKTYTINIKPQAPEHTMVLHLNGESWEDQTIYDNNPTHTDVTLDTENYKYGTGSYCFSGSTDTMDISPTNGMDMATDNFTVSAWIKPTDLNNVHILFWYGGYVSGAPQWWCRTNGTNLQFNVASEGTETILTAANVLKLNEWQYVTVVRDGVNQYIYVNGVKLAEGSYSSVRDVSGDNSLTIGTSRNRNAPRTFSGYMDELMVFNYALSERDIQMLMQGNPLSSEKEILSFSVDGTFAVIKNTDVLLTFGVDIDVTSLVPSITISQNATISPASGVAQDFTNPVKYTVTAEDGTTAVYTVTVTKEAGHTHNMEYFPRVEPSFTSGGKVEYWYCSGCQKYFSDEEGTHELSASELDIPKMELPDELLKTAMWMFAAEMAKTEFPFKDVPSSAWYYDNVKAAWEYELIDGTSKTTFDPDGQLTVAQTIKLAASLHQKQWIGCVRLTNGDPWYSNYINYAVVYGIIDESYQNYHAAQLNAPVTRAEFVHILYGAMRCTAQYNVVADNAIPDVKLTDKYSTDIYAFYRAGILTGTDAQGTFHGENTIRRSEAAVILSRMFQKDQRVSIQLQ